VGGGAKRSARWLGLAALVASLCALLPQAALASPMPDHHQMVALYVIDHNGEMPASDALLLAYSQPFQKILASCRIGVDDLTNRVLALADQAGWNGGRTVTSLQMLDAIARRITWPLSSPHGCGYVYNLAEAHMETGGP
jgi:hypothetical protein